LDEVVGNVAVVESLRAVLSKPHDEIPRAMLFHGPSGTGKTTLARIVATTLGCHEVDFKEVDAADFRGIDTVREIRRSMHLRPLRSPYRMYLLDECHAMSRDAQTALLKALEDTPRHVFFLLATTDPERLLPTIRSRCMEFQTRPLSPGAMLKLLTTVCEKEGKEVDREVLELIVRESMGLPRVALVMLDKVIDLDTRRALRVVERVAVEENKVVNLCRTLLRDDVTWDEVKKVLKGLEDQDPESVRRTVLNYCAAVLMSEDNGWAYLVMSAFKEPFHSTGKAGLVMACYEVVMESGR